MSKLLFTHTQAVDNPNSTEFTQPTVILQPGQTAVVMFYAQVNAVNNAVPIEASVTLIQAATGQEAKLPLITEEARHTSTNRRYHIFPVIWTYTGDDPDATYTLKTSLSRMPNRFGYSVAIYEGIRHDNAVSWWVSYNNKNANMVGDIFVAASQNETLVGGIMARSGKAEFEGEQNDIIQGQVQSTPDDTTTGMAIASFTNQPNAEGHIVTNVHPNLSVPWLAFLLALNGDVEEPPTPTDPPVEQPAAGTFKPLIQRLGLTKDDRITIHVLQEHDQRQAFILIKPGNEYQAILVESRQTITIHTGQIQNEDPNSAESE